LTYWYQPGFKKLQTIKLSSMKENILPAIRITAVSVLMLMVVYPALILGIAQVVPGKGKGETVTVNNKVVVYKLEGQYFSDDKYFSSRPSAAGYNAAGSSGSNKGPTNPDYLKQVQDRIDTFLVHNPGIKKQDIPSDLVTASGSGLDPDISVAAAKVQVKRIAAIRKINAAAIDALIQKQIGQPLPGVMGTTRINVLAINIELEKLK
jgi:K+-transporting ATPase ATPase C chain